MEERARCLQHKADFPGPVVYWMSREQRVRDNWGLLFAQQQAITRQVPLLVVFCLAPAFLQAGRRHYTFMVQGLQKVEQELSRWQIPFTLLRGEPGATVAAFLRQTAATAVVTDFDPLRVKRQWKAELVEQTHCTVWEVDGHNVVPCWLASPKLEYAAYTLRPKLTRQLSKFLIDFPALCVHPYPTAPAEAVDWDAVERWLQTALPTPPVTAVVSGEQEARQKMRIFLADGLEKYPKQRNNPAVSGQSGLSPYLHFGQLAPQRLAWEVLHSQAPARAKEDFLEELIVRRELADNYCWYQPYYDSVAAFPAWAKATLAEHERDLRPQLYSFQQLEAGKTHDPLWNAAQLELVKQGRMHGYMRMYWAKKILEWTPSAATALEIAIFLNDRYQLDGRDPNGYAGIAWSIGGIHDRAWPSRPIFGKIRYMSYGGARGKFDIAAYIQRAEEEK